MNTAKNWSRENLAWAGGLFEGEGCISTACGPRSRVVLRVAITDEDVLDKFIGIIGVGKKRREPIRGSYKQVFSWTLSRGENCQAVLAALWPFLGIRRKQKAKEAIIIFSKYIRSIGRCRRGHKLDRVGAYRYGMSSSSTCKICSHLRYLKRKDEKKNGNYDICRIADGSGGLAS